MGFFSALAALFTGANNSSTKQQQTPEPAIQYNGYTITPQPIKEGNQFRVSATITKGEGEDLQSHTFIRSDVLAMREDCIELTIRKAQLCIDQSGDSLFD